MSQTRLARILDHIINEDVDSAAELLHDELVEKARTIYSEISEAEECEDDKEIDEKCEDDDEKPVEESDDNQDDDDKDKDDLDEGLNEFVGGGDEKEGFIGDVAQDEGEIESDEYADDTGIDGGNEFDGEEAESEEVRIDDLEDQLAELRAEFDVLMGQEAEEPNHDFGDIEGGEDPMGDLDLGGDEFGGEAETDESMFEATKFQDEVSVTVDGEKEATNREAPYTNAPSKQEYGGKPVKTGKDGQGKEVDKTAAKNKDSKTDNVDVPQKDQSADLSGEGKLSGTGKNGNKPSVFSKSPLTKKPK